MFAWLMVVVTACGAKQAGGRREPPASWIEGRWVAADGSVEHWSRVGPHLLGVGLRPDGFETMVITSSGDETKFVAFPGGARGVQFALRDTKTSAVIFSNPAHDFPKNIAYARSGAALTAKISGGGSEVAFSWSLRSANSNDTTQPIESLPQEFDSARVHWLDRELNKTSEHPQRLQLEACQVVARGTAFQFVYATLQCPAIAVAAVWRVEAQRAQLVSVVGLPL
jgi:hypothetical protein